MVINAENTADWKTTDIKGLLTTVTPDMIVINVKGSCLEGAHVPDGSKLIVALDILPNMGEITTCRIDDTLTVKKYYMRTGEKHAVYTRYSDHVKDKLYAVNEVQGVAVACIHNDVMLWEIDIDIERRKKQTEHRRKNPAKSNVSGVFPFEITKPDTRVKYRYINIATKRKGGVTV